MCRRNNFNQKNRLDNSLIENKILSYDQRKNKHQPTTNANFNLGIFADKQVFNLRSGINGDRIDASNSQPKISFYDTNKYERSK